ncbi:MAG: exo-alpha-sialidase [Planctomycetes bacterium]|nr:exo-alpha-sialidase [Planctomycetota bacterium]
MSNFFFLVALLMGFANACISSAELRSELIFPLQNKHVHSSSIVELPNGDLLACWFHGSGERTANDVLIQGSRLRKGNRQWSPIFEMADTPNLPDCNPTLFLDARQRLWLFWVVPIAGRWETSVLKYRRADESLAEGPPKWSWQESIHLVPGETFADSIEAGFAKLKPNEDLWAEYAFPYSRMIVEAAHDPLKRQIGWTTRTHPQTLPSGRILLPLYSDGFNVSLVAISDDEGKTWRASKPMVGLGPIQPSIVRKKDGTLLAYLRDSGGPPARAMQSTSSDEGETWSVALDSAIFNPGSSLEAIVLQDGRWVMAYNDTENGRHRLALSCSDDEGQTWKWKRMLEVGSAGKTGFDYPSIIQARDGMIHLTYSYTQPTGRAIKHVSFEADWVVAESH